jgi:hypothetical protein
MALPQTAAFWLVAGIWVLGVFAATAPSPLYRVYQDQLGCLVAAIWIVNFLAFSIPALIAGWAVTRYGLHRTALVYCAVVAALVAAAAGSLIVRSHARRTSTTGPDRR